MWSKYILIDILIKWHEWLLEIIDDFIGEDAKEATELNHPTDTTRMFSKGMHFHV